ncbi:MAG: alanine racemase, partial [Pseudomonadota bacterium]
MVATWIAPKGPLAEEDAQPYTEELGRHIGEIPTPALIVDTARVAKNAQIMNDRAHLLGVSLRPHFKTCQSIAVANILLGETWSTGAAASLEDVKTYFEAGLRNIRYTSPISPSNVSLVAPLIDNGLHFESIVSDVGIANLLGVEAKQQGVTINVIIELNLYPIPRAGVEYHSKAFFELAATIHQHPNLHLQGIYTDGCIAAQLKDRSKRIQAIEGCRNKLVEAQ